RRTATSLWAPIDVFLRTLAAHASGPWSSPTARHLRTARSAPPLPPLLEAVREFPLGTSIGGAIVDAVPQRVGQVFLIDEGVRGVVSILVALAVPQMRHESCRRVADVKRHGL